MGVLALGLDGSDGSDRARYFLQDHHTQRDDLVLVLVLFRGCRGPSGSLGPPVGRNVCAERRELRLLACVRDQPDSPCAQTTAAAATDEALAIHMRPLSP